MAKKVVATLKKEGGSAMFTKVVKMVKSPKTGSYSFEEKIINKDTAKDFFAQK
ncbi:MAG: DUF4295 domain-containing protein [Bacteroidota bacterium]|nr:DUF4295 domain-containing protein [Bacteroidota bacterium]MDX5427043.1 DUF4295 domain-containing protein [Bacteroidota bacterium]MDX5447633.1 DUF4295 domain-containing protein [Bacteroidota bacterium]MDX5505020.1 DUF4295 domain-containing protein [Bacteroidota bacterium]